MTVQQFVMRLGYVVPLDIATARRSHGLPSEQMYGDRLAAVNSCFKENGEPGVNGPRAKFVKAMQYPQVRIYLMSFILVASLTSILFVAGFSAQTRALFLR